MAPVSLLSRATRSVFTLLIVCSAAASCSQSPDPVSKYVDSISEELWPINKEIHENPELAFHEVRAHKLLTDYLSSHDGWTVQRSAYNMSTAFVAVFEGSGDGPVVSFNAEYGK